MTKFMTNTGNIDYKKIQDRQYLTVDTNEAQKIVSELNNQNIFYSARYDEAKISLTFSKADFDKVNDIISKTQPAPDEPVPSSSDKALEEIQRQLREMQENQRRLEQLANEQKQQQSTAEQQEQSQPEQSAESNKSSIESENSIVPRESTKLLPIISSGVLKQEQKIEDLTFRRDLATDKTSKHQERIEHLSAKAERLSTTNQMLSELIKNKSTPVAVKSSIQALISVNEQKIDKIRNKKIPKRESKIEKQQSKIERLENRINLAQCKINRYKSLSQVVTSFSLFSNADRRRQFSTAMDSLHNNSLALLNAKIDVRTDNIINLTKFYKRSMLSGALAVASGIPLEIQTQKIQRQRLINKRNKLMGVIIPYVSQPENVQEEALKRAEAVVDNALKQENVSVAEIADNVAAAPLPALPEHSIAEPDPIQDMNSILPEIAVVMDMSVSELENKPTDIKELLVLDYTNNFKSTPEEIQASLSAIISPNSSVEDNLEESKQRKGKDIEPEKRENPLKSVEELIEGNANMIDGIINNLPPAEVNQEEHQENKVFTFSRKQLNDNAHKVKEQPSEQKNRDRELQNHDSL